MLSVPARTNCAFLLGLCFIAPHAVVKAAVTAEQRAQVAELATSIRSAGALYNDGKFIESAAGLTEVRQNLRKLIKGQDAALQRLAKPLFQQLKRAEQLLSAKGVQMEPLPKWEDFITPDDGAPETSLSDSGSTSTNAISFSKQIAPILLDNCSGCHIGGRRASGNLRMNSYSQLLVGGDSGRVVEARNSDSLLVRKLKGEEGQRMPAGGRPPLPNEEIELVSKWILQGAVFDGASQDANIESVARQAWAADAAHDDLFDKRQRAALELWARVLPDAEPLTKSSNELFVLGNVPESRLSKTRELFESASDQVAKLLKAPEDVPLIKGGLTVFVLGSRYDYSEFGRMTENRELPKHWTGHWRADLLDAYAVVLPGDLDDKQASALAVQLTAGAYLGAFADTPYWFAEGIARNLVAKAYRRSDDRIVGWQRRLATSLRQLDSGSALLEGRLDEETAGIVGMGITAPLLERKNRRQFDRLLELLRGGRPFDDAFSFAIGPPEAFVKSWISN